MKPLRLTTTRLEKLACPAGVERVYVRDAGTMGLSVCVTETGAKTFYVYRRVRGKPVRVRLGAFPGELGLAAARKEAARVNGEIARGNDPRDAKLAARGEMTFGALFARHIENARPRIKTWKMTQRQFDLYLSRWKSKRLSDITQGDVQSLHASIGERHGKYVANRCLALIHAAFNKTAVAHGFTGPNPAKGVQRFRETSRDRFLHADEMPRFFLALQGESELFRDFFLLALLTGARRGNVQAMRWEDVRLDRREWVIPAAAAKAGEKVVVPLVPEAVEILARRTLAASGPYVFPARRRGVHMVSPKHAWKRILERSGLKDLRIHDLRRTFGSWQAAAGSSLPIIGKSLGHRSVNTTAVYARLAMDPVRKSVETGTAAMLAAGRAKLG